MPFEPVIGLEVHAQLKTDTKIFCNCSTTFGAPPNTHVCPVCLGMPGVLPVLNKKVVDFALRMALATGCIINHHSRFARKNYFYPDLPKGYQISQYELPIAEHGRLTVDVDGQPRQIGITRIHMEEDAGKLIHDPDQPISHVDYNRTGVPLIEIVSEPDMRSPAEAGAYLRALRAIVRCLGICDGNLQEGSFRCDANVSIRPVGQTAFGTRAELKNINSFRFVEKALAYEIARQEEVITDGGEVRQETRLYDADTNRTHTMRGKEEAHDYRYFPDPDLLPLVIDEEWIEALKKEVPELPAARKARYSNTYDLSPDDAHWLSQENDTALYFENCIAAGADPKAAANWMMGPLVALLKTGNTTFAEAPVGPQRLAALLKLVADGTISGKIAKTVFEEMVGSTAAPADIVREKGLVQVSDTAAIGAVIDEILTTNPEQVGQFRGGKTKVIGFFVGQVMRKMKGKANPEVVNEILLEKLKG